MIDWEIQYTEKSERDIREIYEYIAFSLLETQTALKLVRNIIKVVNSLSQMPGRFPLYQEPPTDIELRTVSVGKFVIFYSVDAEKHTVTVISVLYGASDIDNAISDILEDSLKN